MSDQLKVAGAKKEILRVALDRESTAAYSAMVERLKAENPHVKFQASAFVSFLVTDFHRTYFEKDLAVLVAEFFDSNAFYESERKKAKEGSSYEEVLGAALTQARHIKSKRRTHAPRKAVRPPTVNIAEES